MALATASVHQAATADAGRTKPHAGISLPRAPQAACRSSSSILPSCTGAAPSPSPSPPNPQELPAATASRGRSQQQCTAAAERAAQVPGRHQRYRHRDDADRQPGCAAPRHIWLLTCGTGAQRGHPGGVGGWGGCTHNVARPPKTGGGGVCLHAQHGMVANDIRAPSLGLHERCCWQPAGHPMFRAHGV